MDNVHVRHSTRFPTLCTLTVDGEALSSENPPPPSKTDIYDWRLPTNDPRDQGNDLQRLHTLDIYFWILEDANLFMDSVERILPHARIETDRHHAPPSENAMSTVVRKLEDVAVTDPGYQNGQTRNSQTEPVNPVSETQNVPTTGILPPPPPGIPPPTSQQIATGAQSAPEYQTESANSAPLPYNPAAPAAPEPIQHREKTPPPMDGTDGTGLAAAAATDHGVQYNPHVPVTTSFAPPPTQAIPGSIPGTFPGSYASPPPSAGLSHSGSFSSHSIQTPQGVPSYQSQFIPGGGQQVNQPIQMSFAPPPKDTNAHLYDQNIYAPQPHAQTAHQAPIGGYSNYSYGATPQRKTSVNDYDIHHQVYRPTESEANSHHQKYAQQAMKNPGQRPRKLEDGALRVENSVNKILKKLEKRI